MHSEFPWSGTTFNFTFSWGPPFGFLAEFLVNFELKIQKGDPMKIRNCKLSQINETRCASTYDQMDITHQVSSKSHNGFLTNARFRRINLKVLMPFDLIDFINFSSYTIISAPRLLDTKRVLNYLAKISWKSPPGNLAKFQKSLIIFFSKWWLILTDCSDC